MGTFWCNKVKPRFINDRVNFKLFSFYLTLPGRVCVSNFLPMKKWFTWKTHLNVFFYIVWLMYSFVVLSWTICFFPVKHEQPKLIVLYSMLNSVMMMLLLPLLDFLAILYNYIIIKSYIKFNKTPKISHYWSIYLGLMWFAWTFYKSWESKATALIYKSEVKYQSFLHFDHMMIDFKFMSKFIIDIWENQNGHIIWVVILIQYICDETKKVFETITITVCVGWQSLISLVTTCDT